MWVGFREFQVEGVRSVVFLVASLALISQLPYGSGNYADDPVSG